MSNFSPACTRCLPRHTSFLSASERAKVAKLSTSHIALRRHTMHLETMIRGFGKSSSARGACQSDDFRWLRFFERIAKTYKREHWGSMLRSILLMWYDCARHLSQVELTVRLLFELLAPGEQSLWFLSLDGLTCTCRSRDYSRRTADISRGFGVHS